MLMDKRLWVVEWEDAWKSATTDVTGKTAEAQHKPVPTHTVGYMVRQDERGIQIANERSVDPDTQEEGFRGVTFVPRAMVIAVTPFTLTKVKTKVKKPVDTPPEG